MTAHCPCCGAPVATMPPAEVMARQLPPVQSAVLRALSADFGSYIPTHRLVTRVWANDPSGGPANANVCVSQAVARFRPRAADYGLAVDVLRYQGYRVRAA